MPSAAFKSFLTARRANIAALLVAFVASRLLLAVWAVGFGAHSDVETTYRVWAVEVVAEGEVPYSEVDIEYPPASLPFVLVPQLVGADETGYRLGFVGLMIIVDALGAWALMRLARRRGSLLGPWIWTLAIFLLGPLVYLRLDLVPAVATLWMVERGDVGRWMGAGLFLGAAVAVKAYPIVLLPAALMVCPALARRRFLAGLLPVIALPLLVFAGLMGPLIEDVIGYHSKRGIQIESLWGSLLYILRSRDRLILIAHNYGAHHFEQGLVPAIKLIATVATITVTAIGTWLATRVRTNRDAFAASSFVTIALVVAVASVFSPQFMIWVIALAAAAGCYVDSKVGRQALLIVGVAGITGFIYPTLHPGLVRAENLSIIVVWFRNLLLLLTGIYGAVRIYESVSDPSTRAVASPGRQ